MSSATSIHFTSETEQTETQTATQKLKRHPGFWAAFNGWWRAFYAQTGNRPKVADIDWWYVSPECLTTWTPEERPTIEEVKMHSKGMRTQEGVREYFRKWRQKKRMRRTAGSYESSSSTEDEDADKRPVAAVRRRPMQTRSSCPASGLSFQSPELLPNWHAPAHGGRHVSSSQDTWQESQDQPPLVHIGHSQAAALTGPLQLGMYEAPEEDSGTPLADLLRLTSAMSPFKPLEDAPTAAAEGGPHIGSAQSSLAFGDLGGDLARDRSAGSCRDAKLNSQGGDADVFGAGLASFFYDTDFGHAAAPPEALPLALALGVDACQSGSLLNAVAHGRVSDALQTQASSLLQPADTACGSSIPSAAATDLASSDANIGAPRLGSGGSGVYDTGTAPPSDCKFNHRKRGSEVPCGDHADAAPTSRVAGAPASGMVDTKAGKGDRFSLTANPTLKSFKSAPDSSSDTLAGPHPNDMLHDRGRPLDPASQPGFCTRRMTEPTGHQCSGVSTGGAGRVRSHSVTGIWAPAALCLEGMEPFCHQTCAPLQQRQNSWKPSASMRDVSVRVPGKMAMPLSTDGEQSLSQQEQWQVGEPPSQSGFGSQPLHEGPGSQTIPGLQEQHSESASNASTCFPAPGGRTRPVSIPVGVPSARGNSAGYGLYGPYARPAYYMYPDPYAYAYAPDPYGFYRPLPYPANGSAYSACGYGPRGMYAHGALAPPPVPPHYPPRYYPGPATLGAQHAMAARGSAPQSRPPMPSVMGGAPGDLIALPCQASQQDALQQCYGAEAPQRTALDCPAANGSEQPSGPAQNLTGPGPVTTQLANYAATAPEQVPCDDADGCEFPELDCDDAEWDRLTKEVFGDLPLDGTDELSLQP